MRRVAWLAVLLCLSCLLVWPIAEAAPSPSWGRTRTQPYQPLSGSGVQAADLSEAVASTNWAGYVATDGPYDSASAGWVVPVVQPSSSLEVSSEWVGIDGYGNSDLIQAGTTEETEDGTTNNYAWYELLPSYAVELGSVSPGDEMTVSVAQDVPGSWTIDLEDVTSGTVYQENLDYSGPLSSAEWIEEVPLVDNQQSTLADFGSVTFVDPLANGSGIPGNATAIDLVDAGEEMASPGAVSGEEFTVTYDGPSTTSTTTGPTTSTSSTSTSSTTSSSTTVSTATTTPPSTATSSAPPTSTTAPPTRTTAPRSPAPSLEASGYDMVGRDGGIFVFTGPGEAGGFYGSLPGLGITVDDVVGMVPSRDDRGYFLVGADGGVFAFGDGAFAGSLPGDGVAVHDVAGIVPTSDDRGYFLVGADGGVFAFGTAPFLGSLPGLGVHVHDVVGIAATPNGQGYWVVEADGAVHAFGDAANYGSLVGAPSPVAGITATPSGTGYWIATRAGGVYPFGAAKSFGSLPASGIVPSEPITSLVPTSNQAGYWLIGTDGGIFAYGDASYEGSLPTLGVQVSDIVGAVPTR